MSPRYHNNIHWDLYAMQYHFPTRSQNLIAPDDVEPLQGSRRDMLHFSFVIGGLKFPNSPSKCLTRRLETTYGAAHPNIFEPS